MIGREFHILHFNQLSIYISTDYENDRSSAKYVDITTKPWLTWGPAWGPFSIMDELWS